VDITNFDYHEEYGFLEKELLGRDRQFRRRQKRKIGSNIDPAAVRSELTDLNDNEHDFVPSYAAALDPLHFERKWIINAVSGFYRDKLITDVTRRVKGGKEANVYCCPATPETGFELLAAKIYRPRTLRHLRNDAIYREGRLTRDKDGKQIRGTREARAMLKKTKFGKHLGIMNWIMHEYLIQKELFEAGADVPKPISQRGKTILMEYIGDDWGPAPTLSEISLPIDEAAPLFDRVMKNVRLMLSHHYIHGDLSAYNILYWEADITVIDFPQMVDARKNQNAQAMLQRDIERVCEYFVKFGVAASPDRISYELWDLYHNGLLER
jgi:RIO kinase 1